MKKINANQLIKRIKLKLRKIHKKEIYIATNGNNEGIFYIKRKENLYILFNFKNILELEKYNRKLKEKLKKVNIK